MHACACVSIFEVFQNLITEFTTSTFRSQRSARTWLQERLPKAHEDEAALRAGESAFHGWLVSLGDVVAGLQLRFWSKS